MPAKSEAQRRLLNARFGHEWVRRHGFDNRGKLPARVGRKGRKKKMPTVGKKKFPYTAKGEKAAKAYSKKTGKRMAAKKKMGGRAKRKRGGY